MKLILFGIYSGSIIWNVVQNFRTFHVVNKCKNFEQYLALRKRKRKRLYIEVLTSLYILVFASVTPIFLARINSFSKFLILSYGLYLCYRFCSSFLYLSSRRYRELEAETLDSMKEELTILEELVDVRSILLLPPITYIVLESIFLVLSTILIFQENVL